MSVPPSPLRMHVFEYRSVMPTTVERLWAFHESPGVLGKLMPPPIIVQILRDERMSLTSGEVEARLWFGPLPVHWLARHEPGPVATSFVDRMLEGPAQVWIHEHIMRPVEGGAELLDRLTIAHRPGGLWGVFTRLTFGRLPLRILFLYRHWRTRRLVMR